MTSLRLAALALLLPAVAAAAEAPFDVVIRGGTLYDGSGGPPRRADLAIRGDRIAALGDLSRAEARSVVDARGLAVAPGFVNMLSWSNESLIEDGRSQSELRQGVTTQIMGEGWSMGPVNDFVRRYMLASQTDVRYDVEWTTLAGYLAFLDRKTARCSPPSSSRCRRTTCAGRSSCPGSRSAPTRPRPRPRAPS